MAINPNIALGIRTPDLGNSLARGVQMGGRLQELRALAEERKRGEQSRNALASLITGQGGAEQQNALAQADPALAMEYRQFQAEQDQAQREQIKSRTAERAARFVALAPKSPRLAISLLQSELQRDDITQIERENIAENLQRIQQEGIDPVFQETQAEIQALVRTGALEAGPDPIKLSEGQQLRTPQGELIAQGTPKNESRVVFDAAGNAFRVNDRTGQIQPLQIQGQAGGDQAGGQSGTGFVTKEEQKKQAQAGQAFDSLQSTLTSNNFVLETIEEVLPRVDSFTAGPAGVALNKIPGTEARDVAAKLDTIKANIGFEELNEMRRNSPTGGALGQVTEREIAFLQALQGNLEASQSPTQLKQNLQRLKKGIQESNKRLRQAYIRDFGEGSLDQAPSRIQNAGGKRPQVEGGGAIDFSELE